MTPNPFPTDQRRLGREWCQGPCIPSPSLALLKGSGAPWGEGPGHTDGVFSWVEWKLKLGLMERLGMRTRAEAEAGSNAALRARD